MTPDLRYLTTPAAGWINALFIATTLLTAGMLLRLLRPVTLPRTSWLVGIGGWLAVQAGLARTGFYQQQLQHLPPHLVLFGILPTVAALAWLLLSRRGHALTDRLSLPALTALSMVRVPVEIVLYALAGQHLVPELMTFAGRNFDIVAGLTAPVAAYAYARGGLGRRGLLAWHLAALALLTTIVGLALLSAPTPLQRLAFAQPNVAILQFPFVWLPVFVVPVVAFTHLVALRRLVRG
ncbi:hypothetical protein SAMN02745146_1651 [Hymenobacter daecheongensis DSM 21074]|uniref:Uncharacterized protein n=1 Tax=Hymenobacter daecheongensis DSM 21074 TaxID=1121955 RepID=A0A1M6ED74_9BACT|nr:hypothetical protein [Hymenobacter daecheongensis]SHI83432.1 hypothetical protein SAMN02745146_1651 [Hymenobacter daecheongensis DSM 21074]